MSNQYGHGQIVKDGLNFCVDAKDPNSATTSAGPWTDVAQGGGLGSGSLTISGAPGFDAAQGYFAFGDGDYASKSSWGTNTDVTEFTMQAWVYLDARAVYTPTVYCGEAAFNHNQRYMMLGVLDVSNHVGVSINKDSGGNRLVHNAYWTGINTGKWWFWTGTMGGDKLKFYANADFKDDYSLSAGYNFSVDGRTLWVGGGFPQAYNDDFEGRVGSVLIYNRALSAEEVKQNFEVQRSRFKI